jgi:hypothetical protein
MTNEDVKANTQAASAPPAPKATKRASVAPRKPRVAKAEGKPGKSATPRKKTPTAAAKVNAKAPKVKAARDGSKTETILGLLKRPGGATLKELMKATSWQAHSVRGFISIAGKKHSVKIESSKNEGGDRVYKIAR